MIEENPYHEAIKVNEREKKQEKEVERDQFICPFQGCNCIPEIISAHCEIGRIIFNCNRNGTIELNVEEYFKMLDGGAKIKVKRNITNSANNNLDNPNKINIINNQDLFSSRDILSVKNKDLCNIIRALNQLVDTQEKHPENYWHNKNVLNMGNFIEEENTSFHCLNGKEYNIDNIIEEEIKGKEKEGKEAMKDLAKDFKVYLDENNINKELHLPLKGQNVEKDYPWLRDRGFELLSKIRFKYLIEINLANNGITNVTPLDNMLLPHLKMINLSDNLIIKIKSVADLQSTYLSEIYLQNNKIDDLGPFLNSHFDYLEMFRVDKNKDAIANKSFPEVKKKYEHCIFYETKSWKEFAEKYNLEFDVNESKTNAYINGEKFNLGSRRCGNIIIMDLFPLIYYPNKIKYLILDDNKLQDVSILNRIPLFNLELLDLSLNMITNIKFIKKLSTRCKKLKILYLNDNKINDITPLVKYDDTGNIPRLIIELFVLTLKNNYLDLKDKVTYEILLSLIQNNNLNNNLNVDYEEKDIHPDGQNTTTEREPININEKDSNNDDEKSENVKKLYD